MTPPTPEEITTAFHEAGHAVMALALGRPVQQVSIVPDPKRLGHCAIKKGAFRPSDDALETAMLIFLGGAAAEIRHRGWYSPGGASQDLRDVRELALQRAGGPKQVERLERRMLDKAEHIFSKPAVWLAVERIAAELLKQPLISGRNAKHLFDRAEAESQR
jgi:ATP-dependent Zn protease